MSDQPAVSRFAPAPTGMLHLGHVLNAEHVWGHAGPALPQAAAGRRVLLRIEDHDRERCRPDYAAAIVEDLAWLGYAWEAPLVRQSERDAVYQEATSVLAAQGVLYGCDCSRREVEASMAARRGQTDAPIAGELHYSGRCRTRGLPLTDGVGWRVRMDPGVERFVDAQLGPQEQEPSLQCGDVLIRDRMGNWTYQFAASVDDFRQGIDLVIRGVDLLASTGRQMRIARLLGRVVPPTFVHHALIMKSPTQKLSKSDGAAGIRELRARGCSPEHVKEAARAGMTRGL